jgi:hypothetical protein
MPGRFMPDWNVFVDARELDEWMEEYSGWVDVCIRMAVRCQIRSKKG